MKKYIQPITEVLDCEYFPLMTDSVTIPAGTGQQPTEAQGKLLIGIEDDFEVDE